MSQEMLRYRLNRLLSGKVPCKLSSRILYVHPPTIDVRCEASRLEDELLVDAKYMGLLTQEQMFSLMLSNGSWSIEEEQRYRSIPTVIETLKLQMWQFHSRFAGKKVEQVRKNLRQRENEYGLLSANKLKYDIYTVEGVALLSRFEYIVINSIYDHNGKVPYDINDGRLLQVLVNLYMSNLMGDIETREVAKSMDWRIRWNASKDASVFGDSRVSLTDEQISTINWAQMYDSIYDSPDCPSKDVLEDDDLLDGWLLTQSRKRDSERNERLGDRHANKPGLQEVFVPADTKEDAARIDAMNNPDAKFMKRQRLQLTKKHGAVKEENMPDSQLTMRQQALLEANKKMKGRN